MASHGIKTSRNRRYGLYALRQHWDRGADDMLVDAAHEAYASAGVTQMTLMHFG